MAARYDGHALLGRATRAGSLSACFVAALRTAPHAPRLALLLTLWLPPVPCACAQDGSALVNVRGGLVAPIAGAAPQVFEEVFVLSQIQPGEYFVANQILRLLK